MHRDRKKERGEYEVKNCGAKERETKEGKDKENSNFGALTAEMTRDGGKVTSVAEEESQVPPLPMPPPPEGTLRNY